MSAPRSGLVAVPFTDLVGSTELRAGWGRRRPSSRRVNEIPIRGVEHSEGQPS